MTDSPPTPPPLLQARGLCFSRNDEPVFGPLDFTLGPGEALLVLGGNGAGKTTLLRVLAGLLAAATGEVRLQGRVVDREHLARGSAYLGHLPGHKAELAAAENLAWARALQGARHAGGQTVLGRGAPSGKGQQNASQPWAGASQR